MFLMSTAEKLWLLSLPAEGGGGGLCGSNGIDVCRITRNLTGDTVSLPITLLIHPNCYTFM